MTGFSGDRFDAVLFDLDGVITSTATMHSAAWKKAFDEFLRERAGDGSFVPFDEQSDYAEYIDGKLRCDGAESFLKARGFDLPRGDLDDPPGEATVCGVANHKNELFEEALGKQPVKVFEGTVAWIGQLRDAGVKIAVVSASSHCTAILENAGIAGLFDTQVDGPTAERMNLAGKPAPDTYLEAAKRLGVEPGRAVVVEDALAGVEAGRRGGFGLVIGVDRKHDAAELRDHGAGLVVSDLREMLGPDGQSKAVEEDRDASA